MNLELHGEEGELRPEGQQEEKIEISAHEEVVDGCLGYVEHIKESQIEELSSKKLGGDVAERSNVAEVNKKLESKVEEDVQPPRPSASEELGGVFQATNAPIYNDSESTYDPFEFEESFPELSGFDNERPTTGCPPASVLSPSPPPPPSPHPLLTLSFSSTQPSALSLPSVPPSTAATTIVAGASSAVQPDSRTALAGSPSHQRTSLSSPFFSVQSLQPDATPPPPDDDDKEVTIPWGGWVHEKPSTRRRSRARVAVEAAGPSSSTAAATSLPPPPTPELTYLLVQYLLRFMVRFERRVMRRLDLLDQAFASQDNELPPLPESPASDEQDQEEEHTEEPTQ
ncbi:wiskott-Aldrich syndrome protein family member 1-like [Arachis ipaensis]|uniref:wiskott-Aldrich syndrome protein family member 1-like n=1 Tax=Arachis ipaensis TaxID=130454 RepID=UPI0007AF4065|nr:wiskott-Aldrich syndrome protein family member 1-like [Arachis ipaensis]